MPDMKCPTSDTLVCMPRGLPYTICTVRTVQLSFARPVFAAASMLGELLTSQALLKRAGWKSEPQHGDGWSVKYLYII